MRAIDQDRLRVLDAAFAGSRVARMPDRQVPGQLSSDRSLNASATWPIARDRRIFSPSDGGDAGALLAAMLQRVQTQVGQVGSFGVAEDAKHAALVLKLVQHRRGRPAPFIAFAPFRSHDCR